MKERKRLWIPESRPIPVVDIELPPIRIGGYYYVYLIDAEKLKESSNFLISSRMLVWTLLEMVIL